jgi:methylthioribose-1-phosphate isomerase
MDMNIEEEIKEIYEFVRDVSSTEAIPAMQLQLDTAIGYGARIGELLNEAERAYSIKKAECLNKLRDMDDETETTRKTKLEAWVADEKKLYKDLRNIQTHLKAREMSLFQSIKTRREERV